MDNVPLNILCFGEALWDMLPDGPQLGGAPLNLAYRLCCLGDQARLVTRVGRDEYGQLAVLRMAELGMDTSLVQYDDQLATGAVDVTFDDRGRPDFNIRRDAAYDRIEVSYELMEAAQGAHALCFGSVALRTPASRTTLDRLLAVTNDDPRFLDLNLRKDCYDWGGIECLLGHASILKLNEDEARLVAFGCELPAEPLPELCDGLLSRWNLAAIVVTLGEHGAYAASADGTRCHDPGYEVPVVDTCGSGDAFSAGFLHEWLGNQPLAAACRLGNILGALATMQRGATEPLNPGMIREFVEARMPRVRRAELAAFEPANAQ